MEFLLNHRGHLRANDNGELSLPACPELLKPSEADDWVDMAELQMPLGRLAQLCCIFTTGKLELVEKYCIHPANVMPRNIIDANLPPGSALSVGEAGCRNIWKESMQ